MEEVPKTDRLKAGFFRADWAGWGPQGVRSVSGDQSWGSDAVLEVGTSFSDAREEKPLVVEMLSSSCWELESLISFTREKPEGEAVPAKGGGAWLWLEVEGWENRAALPPPPPRAVEASREGKWRWDRLMGGLDRTWSWKFRDALLVEGSVLLVLGSGESRPSWGGATSSLPFGGGAWLFCPAPGSAPPPSAASPFLKYFCNQEGTMLFTVSVTRLIRPGCCCLLLA